MFFQSNQTDAEVTFVNRLRFFGAPIAGFNVKELKKIEHEH